MNVLITGGSKGLGFRIAENLVELGHNVGICARNIYGLKTAVDSLWEHAVDSDQKIKYFHRDILDESDILFDEFIREMGKVDVLINNAAIYGQLGKLDNVDWNLWVEAINVNLLGSIFLTKKAITFMKEYNGRNGKIIQISGGGATAPLENMSAYAVSKAGIVRFVECMAMELKDTNIYINAIAPGIMNTELLQEAIDNPNIPEDYKKSVSLSKYSFDAPVALVQYLLSEEANGISGKLISAKYDNWKEFSKHKNEIMLTDAYTLRRVSGGIHFDWDKM